MQSLYEITKTVILNNLSSREVTEIGPFPYTLLRDLKKDQKKRDVDGGNFIANRIDDDYNEKQFDLMLKLAKNIIYGECIDERLKKDVSFKDGRFVLIKQEEEFKKLYCYEDMLSD